MGTMITSDGEFEFPDDLGQPDGEMSFFKIKALGEKKFPREYRFSKNGAVGSLVKTIIHLRKERELLSKSVSSLFQIPAEPYPEDKKNPPST